MDYATLIAPKGTAGALADRANYAPLAAAAPELIKNAQDELFARLRVREMRKGLTLPLALGAYTAPLPSDFLDVEVLVPSFGGKVKRISDDRLLARRVVDSTGALMTGLPFFFGIFDNAFQFDVAAVQPWALTGMYYGAPYIGPAVPASGSTPAVAAVTTSFLTNRYSSLFWAVAAQDGLRLPQGLERRDAPRRRRGEPVSADRGQRRSRLPRARR